MYEGFDSTEESVFICFCDLLDGLSDLSFCSEAKVEFWSKVVESSLKD